MPYRTVPSSSFVLVTGGLGEDGEVAVVGEEVLVAVLVAANLRPARKALRAQVKVRTVRTTHAQPIDLILYKGTNYQLPVFRIQNTRMRIPEHTDLNRNSRGFDETQGRLRHCLRTCFAHAPKCIVTVIQRGGKEFTGHSRTVSRQSQPSATFQIVIVPLSTGFFDLF